MANHGAIRRKDGARVHALSSRARSLAPPARELRPVAGSDSRGAPDAFTPEFFRDESKLQQWSAFVRDLSAQIPPFTLHSWQ